LVERPTAGDFMSSFKYRSLVFKIVAKFMRRTFYKIAVKTSAEFKAFTPDLLIDERFRLSDYGFDGTIIHIPGHTKGSIGILTKERDLIAGDVLANNKKPEPAPNALEFKKLNESIIKLKALTIENVYVGHGKPFFMKLM
jgi:glyoxylase-like metal-dependent hydrolase (beta-lactamase superfamily II)